MSFLCTRCKKEREGEPSIVGPRSNICAECVEARRQRHNDSARRERERRRAEKEKNKPPSDAFVCTRCGRKMFGEPALSGVRRRVCQLCVNAAKEKHLATARKSYRKIHESDKEETERVCGRCGTRHIIFMFNKRGRGRSRWCIDCERVFGKPSSRRKTVESGGAVDMQAEMHRRAMETREAQRKKREGEQE